LHTFCWGEDGKHKLRQGRLLAMGKRPVSAGYRRDTPTSSISRTHRVPGGNQLVEDDEELQMVKEANLTSRGRVRPQSARAFLGNGGSVKNLGASRSRGSVRLNGGLDRPSSARPASAKRAAKQRPASATLGRMKSRPTSSASYGAINSRGGDSYDIMFKGTLKHRPGEAEGK